MLAEQGFRRRPDADKRGRTPLLLLLLELGVRPPDGPTLLGKGVVLQPARLGDHGDWARLRDGSRAHLTQWEPAWEADDMTAASFRRRVRRYWRELRNGTGAPLFIFRPSDGALIGGVSLSNIRYGASRSATIGYWVGAPYTRQGLGRDAVLTLVGHAFSTLGLNRVEAACQPANEASRRLLLGAGFKEEGLARDYLKINGAWRDHLLFAATARDFLATR